MNTKFTKGPWTHCREDNIITAKSQQGLALIEWQARSKHVSIEERDANAALMYAALEQIAALYIDDRSSAMHKALCIANKALKKARGEA